MDTPTLAACGSAAARLDFSLEGFDMELIFSDPYYDTDAWGEGKYCAELARKLAEFDEGVVATETDIGHGADLPAVLVKIFTSVDWSSFLTIGAPAGLFLLGERINKNLDAWIEIAGKFKRLLETFRPTRIDENGALLLVFQELLELKVDVHDIHASVQVVQFTPVPWGKGTLDKRPDALYLVTARVPGKVYITGVKSNAKIEFRHEYGTEWLDF